MLKVKENEDVSTILSVNLFSLPFQKYSSVILDFFNNDVFCGVRDVRMLNLYRTMLQS